MVEVQQLSLAKQFVDDAERQLSRRDDYGNGQAVSLAHDAAELIVRTACKHRGVTNLRDNAILKEMVKLLDETEQAAGRPATPHFQRISDIANSRNGFKHRGTSVTEADARRFVRYGIDFAETALPQFFSLQWRELSLADAIRDAAVRSTIKSAEAYLAEERYKEALVEAVVAVQILERGLDKLLPRTQWRGEFDSNRATADYLNGLRLIAFAALVQIDARDLMRFQSVGVTVTASRSGVRQVVFAMGREPTSNEASFGVEFARDFALAVQARLS
jgi:hypothetical protein